MNAMTDSFSLIVTGWGWSSVEGNMTQFLNAIVLPNPSRVSETYFVASALFCCPSTSSSDSVLDSFFHIHYYYKCYYQINLPYLLDSLCWVDCNIYLLLPSFINLFSLYHTLPCQLTHTSSSSNTPPSFSICLSLYILTFTSSLFTNTRNLLLYSLPSFSSPLPLHYLPSR